MTPKPNDELPLVKEKKCSKCKKVKPIFDFHHDKSRPDNYYPWCKQCYYQYRTTREAFSMKEVLLPSLILNLSPKYEHPATRLFSRSQRRIADSLTLQKKAVWVISQTQNKVWRWRKWSEPAYTDITQFLTEQKGELCEL